MKGRAEEGNRHIVRKYKDYSAGHLARNLIPASIVKSILWNKYAKKSNF